jgi:hypothetical protein
VWSLMDCAGGEECGCEGGCVCVCGVVVDGEGRWEWWEVEGCGKVCVCGEGEWYGREMCVVGVGMGVGVRQGGEVGGGVCGVEFDGLCGRGGVWV